MSLLAGASFVKLVVYVNDITDAPSIERRPTSLRAATDLVAAL